MKQATTKQFRTAVRNVLMQQGITRHVDSWTNGAPQRDQSDSGTRTVGFHVGHSRNTTKCQQIVDGVEAALALQGVTANTRSHLCTVYGVNQYVRGTCTYEATSKRPR